MHRITGKEAYKVDPSLTHAGDRVYLGNRELYVYQVLNKKTIICRSRQNQHDPKLMRLDVALLYTRPERLLDVVFNDATEAAATERNEIGFVPRGLPDPTDAVPGTTEKIEIMRRRYNAGEELHHPDDRSDYEGCRGTMLGIVKELTK